MTEKLKIYLDTSAISYLSQEDALEETRRTLEFWEDVKAGVFEVFLSAAVIEEINKCAPAKRDFLFVCLSEITYTRIKATHEIETLAKQIIRSGVLSSKSHVDSLHIASAIVAGCDYLVSWNMKHMVSARTNDGVRHITINGGYNKISIVTPTKEGIYGTQS